MRNLSILVFILLWPAGGFALPGAESAADLFSRGNIQYQNGAYAAAEQCYRRILDEGTESAALYYNLGNACFKQKRLGDAIYYWEKARRDSPSDQEIRDNLELANLMIVDRLELPATPLPLRLLTAAAGFLTIHQEGWLVWILFVMANVLYSFYLLLKNPRHSSRVLIGSLAIIVLFFAFACSLSLKIYEREYRKSGIVVEQKADVQSGPGRENITVFTIHEGIKVRIHGYSNGWYQISLPNGWSGWLRQDAVRVI
jgi:tetratricopeptide (TPR) repeat protein